MLKIFQTYLPTLFPTAISLWYVGFVIPQHFAAAEY